MFVILALKGNMRYIKKPWAFCKQLSTLIVSCTLIIRILSIGYVIGGFVVNFQDHRLLGEVITKLNQCNLGIFPLGSFINALIFAPTPTVIVNVLNSLVTYIGIYKRRNQYLQIVSMIMIVFYWIHVSIFLKNDISFKWK